MMNQVSVLHRK